MFDKILIANRGEIACRVIKSARKMGIATVAVYSDADRDALHVQMADEAVHIGASPSAESYLVADRIIQACLDTGAPAVYSKGLRDSSKTATSDSMGTNAADCSRSVERSFAQAGTNPTRCQTPKVETAT